MSCKRLPFFLIIIIIIVMFSLTTCEEFPMQSNCEDNSDCFSGPIHCTEKCGCDRSVFYYYNETTEECLIDYKRLILSLGEKYNNQEKIRSEAERLFSGILASAILFIACASACVATACIYCCRVNYTDRQLRNDVRALEKKLGREKMRKVQVKTKPVAESCNVVVENAGVYVI